VSVAQHARLALESLDSRIVPAVLDLTTQGAQGTLGGAIFRQLDPGAAGTDPTREFVRLQPGAPLGGLLGGLLGGSERGYNTDARPLQFDETSDPLATRSLRLGQVPVVTINGVAYREFLLTINQSSSSPTLALDELRIYLGSTGSLSGYTANNKTLGGVTASFDLDAGANVSVKMTDSLNTSTSADVAVLIPESVFAGANPDTFVYLYSKLGGTLGAGATGGAESWSTRQVPQVPPTNGPVTLTGRVTDANGNGLAGVTITLSGFDAAGNNLFPEGDLTFVTDANGTFSFSGPGAGWYQLSISGNGGYPAQSAVVGDADGDGIAGEPEDGTAASSESIIDIYLAGNTNATDYGFILDSGNS
jgi:hypothetical protein